MNRKTLEIQRPYRQIDDGRSFMIAQRVLRLPDEDSGLSHSIVRFENSRVGFGCLKLKRRTAIRISNKKNGQWIIRYCMGNGGKIKGLNKEFIAIDYDGVNELGVTFNKDVHLSVDRADWWDITRWFWSFPDLNVKLSFRLGLIGFLLGIISLADLIAKLFIA